jgi:hypothetical protein
MSIHHVPRELSLRVLSYSNVTATMALVLSLGGSAYAVGALPAGSVGPAQVRDGSLPASKLTPEARRTLTAGTTPRARAAVATVGNVKRLGGLGFDAPARNTAGSAVFLTVRAGVLSAPGQNGHIYLDVTPDDGTGKPNDALWTTAAYVAQRNQLLNLDAAGAGSTLSAIVPAGHWYRLRTLTIAGYSAPTYILDGSYPASYITLG